MKIYLLYYAYEVGISGDMGGFRKLWELADGLQKKGYQVRVFSPRLGKAPALKMLPHTFYPLINLPILRPLSAYLLMFLYAVLKGFKEKPDIVYFRTGLNILPLILGKCLKAKVVLEVNGSFREFHKTVKVSFLRHFLFSITERFNVAFSDRIIVLTPGLKEMLLEYYQVTQDKVEIISSGTDTAKFYPQETGDCKKKIGLSPKRMVIGFAGIFYPHQGVDTLICSAKDILKTYPQALFLIVGSGIMEKRWKELVTQEGVKNFFVFTGQIPYGKMPIYFNAMDIFVAPFSSKRGETSPLKVFDALACAKVVLSSAIPSMNSMAKAFNGSIILVRPDQPSELARGIKELLSNEEKRYSLGQIGREIVLKKFSWEAIADQVSYSLKAIV